MPIGVIINALVVVIGGIVGALAGDKIKIGRASCRERV